MFSLHHVSVCSEQEIASWQTVHADYLFICTTAHHIYGENREKEWVHLRKLMKIQAADFEEPGPEMLLKI